MTVPRDAAVPGQTAAAPTAAAPTAAAPTATTPTDAGAPAPWRTIVTAALGFAPWILYWALLGAVPFRVAVSAAVALSLVVTLAPLLRRARPQDFDLGTAAVFVVLLVVTFATHDTWLERWIQPVTNLGLFVVATGLQLLGRPFTLPYAVAAVDAATAATPGFRWVNRVISGAWCVTFALMTLVSAVPPLVQGDAAVHDGGSLLSVLGYWVVPFTLLGLVGTASGVFPNWFVARLDRPTAARRAPHAAPPPADTAGGRAVLEPSEGAADGPLRLRVDLPAGAPAALPVRVGQVDAFGIWWWSEASVPAAALRAGLDVTDRYATMRPDGLGRRDLDVFAPALDGAVAAVVDLGDGTRAVARARRWFAAPGVTVSDVTAGDAAAGGLVGRLFVPAGPGPHPAVVLFPGSEGGLDSMAANGALLASRGVLALVAATCAVPGRPDDVDELPLELFADALTWLRTRPDVAPDRVAGWAISKGAEGLLAASAALGLDWSALVLVSPSDAVWGSVGPDGPRVGRSSWTLGGRPVPHRDLDGEALMGQLLRNVVRGGADARHDRPTLLRLAPAYAAGAGSDAGTDDGRIDAARVAAPLLLVAGAADELWPSQGMARAVAARRGRADDEVVVLPDAGHLLSLPHRPTPATWTDGIAFGGTPEGTAAADVAFAARLEAFLARHGVAAAVGGPVAR